MKVNNGRRKGRGVGEEKRAYISEIVSAVLDGGSKTLCLPTPGTAQYISYLLFVVSFNWYIKKGVGETVKTDVRTKGSVCRVHMWNDCAETMEKEKLIRRWEMQERKKVRNIK